MSWHSSRMAGVSVEPAGTPARGDGPSPPERRISDEARPLETISGIGDDDLAAMIDLRIRLEERHRGETLGAVDQRGRAAYLEGAKAQSTRRRAGGDGDEPERVTNRYPGLTTAEASGVRFLVAIIFVGAGLQRAADAVRLMRRHRVGAARKPFASRS